MIPPEPGKSILTRPSGITGATKIEEEARQKLFEGATKEEKLFEGRKGLSKFYLNRRGGSEK